MKKLLCLSLLLLVTACATLTGGQQTFNISGAQIAEKLNERFAVPVALSKMLEVNLSNAAVTFDEATGRMTTNMDALVTSKLISKTIAGKLGLSGQLRFDAASNTVMLDVPKVENLELANANGSVNQLLGAMADIVSEQIAAEGIALYAVKPEDLMVAGTQYHPTDLKVVGQGLQVTLVPNQ